MEKKVLMRDILNQIEWKPKDDVTEGGIEAQCNTEYGTFLMSVVPNRTWRHSLVGYVWLVVPGRDEPHHVASHYFTHLESVVNQIYNTISDTITVMDRVSAMNPSELADEANRVEWRRN